MGALRFQSASTSTLKWTSLASALSLVSDGAWTAAWLLKRNTNPVNFDALGYLLSGAGAGVVQAGCSIETTDGMVTDISSQPNSNTGSVAWTFTESTPVILVGAKATGTVRPTYSKYVKASTTWTHDAPSGGATLPNGIASTMLEIGAWEGGDLLDDCHIGVVAFWEGDMTNSQKQELATNWQTSDWWNNTLGTPMFLVELNVAGASVTDLAGNASSLTVSGTSLDAAETLTSWNFNGTGAVASTAPNLVMAPYQGAF